MGLSSPLLSRAVPPAVPRKRPGWTAIAAQGAALVVVIGIVCLVIVTTSNNLQARGIPIGLDFLTDRAGFAVSETLLPFHPDDSTLWAIAVGIGNTLFVSLIVALASTVIGTALGIARLSPNPIVAVLARSWVEVARNTPPILMLIFIYTLWWQILPTDRALTLAPGVLASIRGLAIPSVTVVWPPLAVSVMATLILAGLLAAVFSPMARRIPRLRSSFALGLAVVALFGLVAAFSVGIITVDAPRSSGMDLIGGALLSPELATILIGLTLYTSGFVAEIVRGGLQAVPHGQWEAAASLALRRSETLRLVIMPQMMRIVLPPMTSQYINIVKNSTLALAVGYTDFLTIMGTIINKSSHAVEGTGIIIVVYLTINLTLSLGLNIYNRRLAAKER